MSTDNGWGGRKITHSIKVVSTGYGWLDRKPYEVQRVSFGAPSLAEGEALYDTMIAKGGSYLGEAPYRANIALLCRRCFAGDGNRAKDGPYVDACPCCHGTLNESLYAPEWPANVADAAAVVIRDRLDIEAAEREAYRAREKAEREENEREEARDRERAERAEDAARRVQELQA